MQLFPADAEHKLGFDAIRRRLEGHALSPLGRERLEAIRPSADRAHVERLLTRTAELQQALRADDPIPLAPLPDVRDALRRAGPKGASVEAEDLADVGAVLGTSRRAHGYFKSRRERYPEVAGLATQIEVQKELEEHIGRTVDERGQVRDDASPELRRISRTLAERQSRLRSTLLAALRDATSQGYATEEQPTIRNGRAVIPVRAEAKRKVQGFVHDVSGSGQTVYIEPAAVLDLNNEVRELELERGREIRRILQEVTGHVRSRLPAIRAALDVLGRIDALQARARLANELDALVPELNDEGRIGIVRGRNPVLALHFRRTADADEGASEAPRSVVPLDLELSDAQRTLVITGPNAGGKSVAMKTVGVLALMVACGLPVPAAPGTSFGLFERLFVDIGDQQSIEQDLSTFTSHLGNLRRMLADADDRTLVLIDEAGTGTDPAEGGALAQSVLETLTARGARTVATTHHGTLKAFAHNTDGVENGSMQFDQATLSPTYRFQEGIPGSSYAFEIAGRVGLDGAVLDRARALVGEGKTALEDLIATFEAQSQALEAELEQARDEAQRAKRARKEYEDRAGSLKSRKSEIVEQALEEAERIVGEANARVERTIREIKEAQAATDETRAAREQLEGFKQQVERKKQRKVRRTPKPKPDAVKVDGGPIRVGDQVRLDDGQTTGEVLEIDEKEAVVALGQMKVRAKLKRLTKVGGKRKQRVEVRAPRGERAGGHTSMPALDAQRRVDVRGQRVEEAIPVVMRLVDGATMAGLQMVEVLHGTGTGALRAAIREYLDTRTEVSRFGDAPWEEGGPGVTVVSLR
ncbi:MAG: endonuclease MutS2 [Rhodothermales bacterium]